MKSQFRGSPNKELIECMPNSTITYLKSSSTYCQPFTVFVCLLLLFVFSSMYINIPAANLANKSPGKFHLQPGNLGIAPPPPLPSPTGSNDGHAVTSNPSCFLPKELQVTRFHLIVEWRSPPKIVTTTVDPTKAVPYSAGELGGITPVLLQI